MSGVRRVPLWLRRAAFVYVGPCLGFFRDVDVDEPLEGVCPRRTCLTTDAPIHRALLGVRKFVTRVTGTLTSRLTVRLLEVLERNSQRSYGDVAYDERRAITRRRKTTEKRPRGFGQVKAGMDIILERSNDQMSDTLNREFWRCVAKTVDRLCFASLGFIFVFLTTAFLLRGYGHSATVEGEEHLHRVVSD